MIKALNEKGTQKNKHFDLIQKGTDPLPLSH